MLYTNVNLSKLTDYLVTIPSINETCIFFFLFFVLLFLHELKICFFHIS